jgi:hypothetical protein
MKRLVITAAIILAVTAGAVAQDYFYTNFQWGHTDYPLPGSPPCFSPHPVMPMVYDGSAWMVWTCADGRVIPRRFIHPNDNTRLTFPTDPRPTAASPQPSSCPGIAPATSWKCVNGGWLPPDHPLAR